MFFSRMQLPIMSVSLLTHNSEEICPGRIHGEGGDTTPVLGWLNGTRLRVQNRYASQWVGYSANTGQGNKVDSRVGGK
jgi:hypothetical protein